MDKELAFTPAWQLRDLIGEKKISPVELTQLYFDRIDSRDAQLNSYLTLDYDGAMSTAKAAEQAVLRGDRLGPLHGLPIAVKDLEMTKGIRSTSGSLVYKDRIPTADSIVVERIRRAGVIILGKTNTPEFGLIGINENRLGDHCRNPWNTQRTTGASSGGAGAAMAAGLCALATGGDGGGSIRIPAAFCGLFGIKNTQGRVPKYSGVPGPLVPNLLSQQGPISRNVRDSAMVLQVVAGFDSRDASSLRETPPDFVAALDRDISGLRIGWTPDFGFASSDPEVLASASAAARVFEELGCTLDESKIKLDSPFDSWWILFTAATYAANAGLLDSHLDDLTWYVRDALEAAREWTAIDYNRALGQRDRMIVQFADEFERFDLLLSPAMPTTAFPVDKLPKEIAGKPVYPSPAYGFHPYTYPINTIGYPAASVPCGFSSDGMPIGLHIIGRKGDEATVFAASAAFERARPWAQHFPTVS
jgi:aspartyl-tRNA(Asn)/glutamyl-tRNA(Gln) amidotransferase subunit A